MDYTGPKGGREFLDFNNDGLIELEITWIYQTNRSWLYLFDRIDSAFKRVSAFWGFPDAKTLSKGSQFFYSYVKTGCADNDWVSYLFKIQDFTTAKIAAIIGQGCEYNNSDSQIIIRKYTIENDFEQVEKLPYDQINSFSDHEWGFIKNYWRKNISRFNK
jgi:hypothetical protein